MISVISVDHYGATGLKFQVVANYPIKSDIRIGFIGRGEYAIRQEDGRDIYSDFEGVEDGYTLTAGEKSWYFIYFPGIDSQGDITEVNWAMILTEFSDSDFNYKKDNYTGIEYY